MVIIALIIVAAACVNPIVAAAGGNYDSDVPNRLEYGARWTNVFVHLMNQGDRDDAWERGLNDKPLIATENLDVSPIEAIDTRRLSVTNTTLEASISMLGSFDNVQPLSANAQGIFETVTADTITAHFNEEFNSSAFDVLEIRTMVVSMEKNSFGDFSSHATARRPMMDDGPPTPTPSPGGRLRTLKLGGKGVVDSSSVSLVQSGRELQSENNDLLIAFDVVVSIRTANLSTEMKAERQVQTRLERHVFQAFSKKKKRTRYIFDLQEYEKEEEAFDAINRVAMMIEGEELVVAASSSPDVKKKFWRTIYGPIVIGVGVFLLLCCIYLLWRRKRVDNPSIPVVPNEQESSKMSFNEEEFAEESTNDIEMQPRSTINLVDSDDQDISTLGNSQRPPSAPLYGDPQFTTFPHDEYYAEAEENLSLPHRNDSIASSDRSTISQALSKMTLEHTDDNSSVEDERIEVFARADRLGIVIDTSIGGAPIVHAIKNTSVLMDQVHLRDTLAVVDGVDTSKMSALDVSKLIQSIGQKKCVFVFSRSEAEDLDEIMKSYP